MLLIFLTTLLLCMGLAGCAGLHRTEVTALDANAELRHLQIAILPFDNLSGKAAPVKELRRVLMNRLRESGLSLLDDAELERFMAAHRLRYTGGLDTETARLLKTETGVDAVIITTVELYHKDVPPKIALLCRLVSTGRSPEILWMDGVSFTGNQSPAILGLGLIEDPVKLRDKAFGRLISSLVSYRPPGKGPVGDRFGYAPRSVFAAPTLQRGIRYSVAVVPFANKSDRRNAGELIALHFVRQIVRSGDFEVIDPGIVRQSLINMRMVMPEGVSFADMDGLFSLLNTDLVLIGKDFDYQDPQDPMGVPKVEFSTILIERTSHKIIWSSGNHNEGDNYIYAFDWGKVYTAHDLMSRMAARVARMMHDKIFK